MTNTANSHLPRCPNCHTEVEVSSLLREHVEAELRGSLEAEHQRRLAEHAQRAQAELDAVQQRLDEAAGKEAELVKLQRETAMREQKIQLDAERRITEEVARVREHEISSVREEAAREAEDRVRQKDVELAAMNQRLAEATGKEVELLKLQREIETREQQIKLDAERQIAEEVALVRARDQKAAEERAARELEERERRHAGELDASRKKLAEAATREAELLRKAREVEDREQQAALELERKVSEEVTRIREQSAKLAEERVGAERAQQQLANEQHRLQIEGLQRTIEELNRKAHQGSQQAQGEAQEVVLSEVLGDAFPLDEIDDVPKGINGADLLQHVRGPAGLACDTIIWESKRTRAWSDGWLAKLRDDQRETGATAAVIVTQTMPEGVRHFEMIDGVWVCEWAYASALAGVLRTGMIELAIARRAAEGRGEKMQMLYGYLTGAEFKNRVTGVLEAFRELREDLQSERTAMMLRWKKREKQLDRAHTNMASLYGDLQGISGARLDAIPALALDPRPALPASTDDEADGGDDNDAPEAACAAGSGPHAALRPEEPRLVELLFALLPESGDTVGNGSLCERFVDAAFERLGLSVTADDYATCRGKLLASGRARRGKGRGGSVARADGS
jgi:hypothetical protein